MRVPDEFRRTVACVGEQYVSEEGQPGVRYGATAFFVGMPLKDLPTSDVVPYLYLVTAKHVALRLEGREFIIALNNREGTETVQLMVTSEQSEWYFHPTDNNIDVAVFRWPGVSLHFDPLVIHVKYFLTNDVLRTRNIGAGDEVFMVGLFAHLKDTKKNLPIVRMGTIALIPDEPVPTQLGATEAYLIEARSIGGLSGSPVFVPHGSGLFLMGLMHGHWDIPPEDRDIPEFPISQDDAERTGKVNMGIAIVVPAMKIMEVLNHPELAALRGVTTSDSDAEQTLRTGESTQGDAAQMQE